MRRVVHQIINGLIVWSWTQIAHQYAPSNACLETLTLCGTYKV